MGVHEPFDVGAYGPLRWPVCEAASLAWRTWPSMWSGVPRLCPSQDGRWECSDPSMWVLAPRCAVMCSGAASPTGRTWPSVWPGVPRWGPSGGSPVRSASLVPAGFSFGRSRVHRGVLGLRCGRVCHALPFDVVGCGWSALQVGRRCGLRRTMRRGACLVRRIRLRHGSKWKQMFNPSGIFRLNRNDTENPSPYNRIWERAAICCNPSP